MSLPMEPCKRADMLLPIELRTERLGAVFPSAILVATSVIEAFRQLSEAKRELAPDERHKTLQCGDTVYGAASRKALGLADAQLATMAMRGRFSRNDGVSIQFCNFRQEGAKHHVLLLTGWDESFLKYGEIISELLEAGFNVYTMDWRSQGLSGRLLLNQQVTYVKRFEDYIEDLSFFINEVVVGSFEVESSQLTCLAHSMGALIALMAAAGDKGWFHRLVATAPMLRSKTGIPHLVDLRLGKLLCALGLGKCYAFGEGGIDVNKSMNPKLTTDGKRLRTWQKIRHVYPIVAMGGVTTHWFVEAVKAQDWLERRASQVRIPVLVLEADIDTFASSSRPLRKLCRVASDCKRVHYPTTCRDILFEGDWARSHAMQTSIAFLKWGVTPTEKLKIVKTPPEMEESRVVRLLVNGLPRGLFLRSPTGSGGAVDATCSTPYVLVGKGNKQRAYICLAFVSGVAAGAAAVIAVRYPTRGTGGYGVR